MSGRPALRIIENGVEKKLCKACNEIKPISDFYLKKRDGYPVSRCKTCMAKYFSKLHRQDPEKARSRNIKIKYGITLLDAKDILDSQFGICANRACGQPLSFAASKGKKNKAHIDHDHKTGKVRGILCHVCNVSLGYLENKNRMLGLAEYLDKQRRV